MDIATYDHLDLAARATLSSWIEEAVFAPVTFEMTGFPTRIRHIGQIRSLLAGMHGSDRIPRYIEELGGLRDDDVEALRAAVDGFRRWHRSLFPGGGGYLPLADLLSQYISWRKLRGLAAGRGAYKAGVLEIGAGYGLTSLFVAGDRVVGHYSAVETTQSLYVIQSLLAAAAFRDRFWNSALLEDRRGLPIPDFRAARDRECGRFRFWNDEPPRAALHPWWRLEEVLGAAQCYDVIMSNGNVAEMSGPALDWYLPKWHAALADDGYLVIQDLGKVTTRTPEQVLRSIDAAGFRALARGHAGSGALYMPLFTLVLVTDRHPDYAVARPLSHTAPFVADHPAIQAAFGLDREPGRMLTVQQLAGELGLEVA